MKIYQNFLLIVTQVLLLMVCVGNSLQAQDAAKIFGWKHSVSGGINFSQVAFTNWTPGGENSLAYLASANASSIDDEELYNWEWKMNLAFGQQRLSVSGLRKTDDKIDFSTVFAYKLKTELNPYAALTAKTQFAKGFTYEDNGTETAVSKIFDPGYFTQTAGMIYIPGPAFKTRLGAGLREVVTSEFSQYLYADDPATPLVERILVQGGLESVSELNLKLDSNIFFTSKLEMFAPLKSISRVIVTSDNQIKFQVNKFINASVNVVLMNNPDQIGGRTQVKEAISIGLNYTLL